MVGGNFDIRKYMASICPRTRVRRMTDVARTCCRRASRHLKQIGGRSRSVSSLMRMKRLVVAALNYTRSVRQGINVPLEVGWGVRGFASATDRLSQFGLAAKQINFTGTGTYGKHCPVRTNIDASIEACSHLLPLTLHLHVSPRKHRGMCFPSDFCVAVCAFVFTTRL
jgi:D-serine deaminase-like pyridoxal phosphate-dependent protein